MEASSRQRYQTGPRQSGCRRPSSQPKGSVVRRVRDVRFATRGYGSFRSSPACNQEQIPWRLRVVRREVAAGFALGCMLGSIGMIRILAWQTVRPGLYGPHYLLVAMTVACSLIGVVLFGTVVGSMLPFVLRSFGFDPASASAPFVATLVDVTGLVI